MSRQLGGTDVLAHRIAAQQLDRPSADRPVTDAAVLDLGVQDTGRDGASWALVNRGVPVAGPDELAATDELALVWSLRASPHLYRRADLPDVLVATSPFSESDAAKRVIGADQPLRAAGISTRDGLAEVARQLHRLVAEPATKGEVSTRLSQVLAPPYLRDCVPCGAVHAWEMPFRLGAFYGGLELEPGTSPPVLRRIPRWSRSEPGPAADPMAAPERLQVIRSYLRFLGPARPQEVAGFLGAFLPDVRANWPADAVEVTVLGRKAWSLGEAPEASVDEDLVRLLGPYDLFMQAQDRAVLVPDKSRHRALWPPLGRPGAVLVGAGIVGAWRPRAAGRKFSLRLDLWSAPGPGVLDGVEEQARRLAEHRGLVFAGVVPE